MKLKKLEIEIIPSYRENAGQYQGIIQYEGGSGEITMALDKDVSNALLMCIGETITKFAANAAREVEKSIIASVEDAKSLPKLIEA